MIVSIRALSPSAFLKLLHESSESGVPTSNRLYQYAWADDPALSVARITHHPERHLCSGLAEPIEGEPDLDVPKSLIPIDELEEKIRTQQPAFVKLETAEKEGITAYRTYDEHTGVVQRRLSNGIRINYKVSKQSLGGCVYVLVKSPFDSSAGVLAKLFLYSSCFWIF